MIKAIFMLKRKDGITHEQFREHYERHSEIALKHFGHLLVGYTRNYAGEVRGSRSFGRKIIPWNFDVITEWVLADEAALEDIYRMFKVPEIGQEFYEDEEHFLDREAVVVVTCREGDIFDTGTGGGHGSLELNEG